MAKPDVLQLGPYPDWDQGPLEAAFTMHRLDLAADRTIFLRKIGPGIRGIAARGTHVVDRTLIEACPALEIVAVYGVGYDGVDLEACRDHRVRVTNTPDVLTADVADLGVAMMLGLSRRICAAEAWVRSGDWAATGGFALTRRASGARAGILGLGRIGFQVGRRLAGFDMDIAYCDVAPRDGVDWRYMADPVALARHADFLFVTLAATQATRHIVGPDVLTALGPEGVLINISRASNVDEAALLDALETQSIGGAALDVFDGEPRIDPRFLGLDNVLLQPHHASGTVETRKAMGQLMRDNLAAHFAGKPLPTPVI
ncbi:MAG: 2-hydroxyacid dehydrogenase [Rhodobacter sp.]|nr:2-hydroxyacid dehydrogenase [Rhodobacter sp.]